MTPSRVASLLACLSLTLACTDSSPSQTEQQDATGGEGTSSASHNDFDGSTDAAALAGSADASLMMPDSGSNGGVAAGGSVGTSGADAGGTAPEPPDSGPQCALCSSYGSAEKAGTITATGLDQLSGIAASRNNPGVLFVHNDHNAARFFAVSEDGTLLGTFNIMGASVMDIEDIAVGPCPQGSCVYIADIGDNITPRQQYVILRVSEPTIVAGSAQTAIESFEQLSYSYPDGTHNGESLLVDPSTSVMYVISKLAAGMPSSVYRLPPFGQDGVASKIADLPVPAAGDQSATAADAHPCAPAFLLRTYNTLYEFRAPEGASLEDAFKTTPTEVPVAEEQQGEGVAYRPDGLGYYTTSEGVSPPIDRVGCINVRR